MALASLEFLESPPPPHQDLFQFQPFIQPYGKLSHAAILNPSLFLLTLLIPISWPCRVTSNFPRFCLNRTVQILLWRVTKISPPHLCNFFLPGYSVVPFSLDYGPFQPTFLHFPFSLITAKFPTVPFILPPLLFADIFCDGCFDQT